MPTLGQRSRDPVAAPDGIIRWVNSGLGRLGRHDPVTGDLQEWDSPSGPNSHPCATAAFDDAVWYQSNPGLAMAAQS